MAKANPLVQISKRIASLQAKSAKMNEEIKALAGLVADAEKQAAAAPQAPAKGAPQKAAPAGKKAAAPVAAKAPAKAAVKPAAPAAAPKKRGRPSKK